MYKNYSINIWNNFCNVLRILTITIKYSNTYFCSKHSKYAFELFLKRNVIQVWQITWNFRIYGAYNINKYDIIYGVIIVEKLTIIVKC